MRRRNALRQRSSIRTVVTIDENLGGPASDAREAEADELAGAWILPEPLALTGRVSGSSVSAEASRLGVHPALVVGRLHHEGALPWSHLNKLVPSVRSYLEGW